MPCARTISTVNPRCTVGSGKRRTPWLRMQLANESASASWVLDNQLGDTFDGLLARPERAFEAQRRFVSNASHELRTPMTLERTLLEVALADPAADA
jgi:signal transduction histidine kinase